jgi:5'-methylthioadenosine phosphorylase
MASDQVPTVTGSRLGLIIGSALADGTGAEPHHEVLVDTAYGPCRLFDTGDVVVAHRHHATPDGYVLPHVLDHHRTVAGLCAAGCDRVVALASVGSLRGWPVGTVVCPFDFFAPGIAPSFHTDPMAHSVPGFDEPWRDAVLAIWDEHAQSSLLDGGVYAQTVGPRFETPAEVRALGRDADVVGMTVASECILAKEAGLAYVVVCMVDNAANGVDDVPLSVDEFRHNVEANRIRLLADLAAVLPHLVATPRPT